MDYIDYQKKMVDQARVPASIKDAKTNWELMAWLRKKSSLIKRRRQKMRLSESIGSTTTNLE